MLIQFFCFPHKFVFARLILVEFDESSRRINRIQINCFNLGHIVVASIQSLQFELCTEKNLNSSTLFLHFPFHSQPSKYLNYRGKLKNTERNYRLPAFFYLLHRRRQSTVFFGIKMEENSLNYIKISERE